MVQKKHFNDINQLQEHVGKNVGVSEWMQISQERINQFAEATGDFQWIHIDKEKAEEQSPFGTTIAHGYLILSLIPKLMGETVTYSNVTMGINYGLDKVRFTNPVPAESFIRVHITVSEVKSVDHGLKVKNQVTIQIRGQEKPACIAETIAILLKN